MTTSMDIYVCVGDGEMQDWLASHGLEDEVTCHALAEAHGGWVLVRVEAPTLVPFLQAYTGLDSDDELILFNAYERSMG